MKACTTKKRRPYYLLLAELRSLDVKMMLVACVKCGNAVKCPMGVRGFDVRMLNYSLIQAHRQDLGLKPEPARRMTAPDDR